ncbi:MAG: polysaccharide biosynthesis protein [Planctomycetes bacterium]|nr:polysaccharide biosynthesis protein [Planctomycetota bacterium]
MAVAKRQNLRDGRLGRCFTVLESLMAQHRLTTNLVAHNILFALAFLAAFLVRFDAGIPGSQDGRWFYKQFLPFLPYILVTKSIIFASLKLLRDRWRYASIHDVWRILEASWIFLVVTFVVVVLTYYLPQLLGRERLYSYSRGVLMLDFLSTVFLVCVARLGVRIYHEELRPISAEGVNRVMIVGAGNAAETLIREINRMDEERYRVIGLVDDDPTKQGLNIHGVGVLGTTDQIKQLCEEYEIDEILIAMPSASQKQLRRVVSLCRGTNLKFKAMPGVSDLINERFTVSQIREVDINDLLGRETVNLDHEAISRFISHRRVLVTGAGGSIGSEMCRQIATIGPSRLILLEQAETPLFEIENELQDRCGGIAVTGVICDIYDRARVETIFKEHRPEVVIHAAAHKHVPLMERNPCEALKNNIFGTRNVADAACACGTDEFVMISTDKAVNPSSIMGCSKRVAELYVQGLNGRAGCKTQFKAVRFGNVLDSAGSVVPIFKKQIAEGGPVRVTHPDMTRYFMTISEASQLVLQAAATGAGGQIFLLDMGEPVKIVDLARDLITLSGFRPEEDIEIVFTGIRPGEKLFEKLRTQGEDIVETVHEKVRVWRTCQMDWDELLAGMKELEKLVNTQDRDQIVCCLRTLVPDTSR